MNFVNFELNNKKMKISSIAMGTMRVGYKPRLHEFSRMIDYYVDCGGNCIDTARLYLDGSSEACVGKWLAKSKKRNQIILSTKGGNATYSNPNRKRVNAREIELDLYESLKALQTDYIDLYWIHQDDETVPVEPIVDKMNEFIRKGLIGLPGCSNWSTKRIHFANNYARETGQIGFIASQIGWSIADCVYNNDVNDLYMNHDEFDWYEKNNVFVFAYSSQANGYYQKIESDKLDEHVIKKYDSLSNRNKYEEIKRLEEVNNTTCSNIVLNYITNNIIPGIAIIGCNSVDQLQNSILNYRKLENSIFHGFW